MKHISLFILIFLTGCAITSDQTKGMTDAAVCGIYGHHATAAATTSKPTPELLVLVDELKARGLYSSDVAAIATDREAAKTIGIGMTKCAVMAKFGPPSVVNSTVTANGKTEQWVYRGDRFYGKTFSYVTNDRYVYFAGRYVTAYQM
jgi:hypothetical protein